MLPIFKSSNFYGFGYKSTQTIGTSCDIPTAIYNIRSRYNFNTSQLPVGPQVITSGYEHGSVIYGNYICINMSQLPVCPQVITSGCEHGSVIIISVKDLQNLSTLLTVA